MGLLSAIFGVFSKPNSSNTSDEFSKYPEGYEEALEEAANKTLDLVSGLSRSQKNEIVFYLTEIPNGYKKDIYKLRDTCYSKIKDAEWTWEEWTFWQKICLEKNLTTDGMRCFCLPVPEVPNLEKLRRVTPNSYISKLSINQINSLAKTWQGSPSFKTKKSAAEYLSNNLELFHSITDPAIIEKWKHRKVNLDPTPEHIFNLMWSTISDRAQNICDRKNGDTGALDWSLAKDDPENDVNQDYKLYRLSKSKQLKDSVPWQEKIMPNIPGLFFEY